MSVCVALRDDYDGLRLRDLAKASRDPRQVCRLLALAAAYDGMSRAAAAKVSSGLLAALPIASPSRFL